MPAIVVASIITAGAGIGATVYSSRAAGSNQRRAAAAENQALDRSLAHQTAATDKALQHERDLDDRRHDEWKTEQDDARAAHEWYQQALEPYRQASTGALGSLGDLVSRLGGGGGMMAGINLDGLFSQVPTSQKLPSDPRQPTNGTGRPGPAGGSGPWAPSDLVRTGTPGAPLAARSPRVPTSTARSRAMANAQPGAFSGGAGAGGDQAVPSAIMDAAATIADIVRNLPANGRPMSSDAYLG